MLHGWLLTLWMVPVLMMYHTIVGHRYSSIPTIELVPTALKYAPNSPGISYTENQDLKLSGSAQSVLHDNARLSTMLSEPVRFVAHYAHTL